MSDAWSEFAPPFEPDVVVDPATWRTVRGGTMWNETFYGQDCTSRHGHPRTDKYEDDGFRCCAGPL